MGPYTARWYFFIFYFHINSYLFFLEAITHKHDAVVKILQEHNAKHGASSDYGIDLINAGKYHHLSCFARKFFLFLYTYLKYLASAGDVENVKRLLESGIRVDSMDYDRRTPLHVAIAERQLEIVKILVEAGADVHTEDRFGNTPLDVSVFSNDFFGNVADIYIYV